MARKSGEHWAVVGENWINVEPGAPAFLVASNLCDWFELGSRENADYWLHGKILDGGEFVFNARLFLPGIVEAGVIIDNFPKGPNPPGWHKKQSLDLEGYDLVNAQGDVIFGYRVDENVCKVIVNIHAADGSIIARSSSDAFLIHRGPAEIGGAIFLE